jgi:DNA-binding IclR family transcriptional regulator
MNENESRTGTQSIERAALVLRQIASYSPNGLRLVDLSTQLNLKRSTIHRIINCLVREKLVMQNQLTERYTLGYSLFELGLTAASQFKLREVCLPSLNRIAKQSGHTAYMTIRSHLDAISIASAVADQHHPMDVASISIGAHRPLGVGAGSLAILITLPDDEIKRIVLANARRLFAFGKLTVPLLMEIVSEAQEAGYAFHDDRMISNVSGVGIVVRDNTGTPFGAISISAKADSLTTEQQQIIVSILNKESYILENLFPQSSITAS